MVWERCPGAEGSESVVKLDRSESIAAELWVVHPTCATVHTFASSECSLSLQQLKRVKAIQFPNDASTGAYDR